LTRDLDYVVDLPLAAWPNIVSFLAGACVGVIGGLGVPGRWGAKYAPVTAGFLLVCGCTLSSVGFGDLSQYYEGKGVSHLNAFILEGSLGIGLAIGAYFKRSALDSSSRAA
jgi:hypothetical protein